LKFLSLIAALLLEQMRPLPLGNPVQLAFERYAAALEAHFNAGERHHGVIAWLLAVVPVVAATVLIAHALHAVNPLLGWAWNIAVLYVAMGFRAFGEYFRQIIQALREGDHAKARECLVRWQGEATLASSPMEVARVSIENGLVSAHLHVFGPIAAFVVLGPGGAMLYRTAAILGTTWGRRRDPESGDFGEFARRFFYWLDWLPARLTAASFAIVGNFEDAVYCWRTQAMTSAGAEHALLLASGGGAIGVRLGASAVYVEGDVRPGESAAHEDANVRLGSEFGLGDEADVDYMQSAVGLLWRALVLWLFLIFLVTVAHSLG
jgi:cobalamin biosynthesis protein CobD/CbiB